MKPKIAFFGTPDFAVWVLDGLKERGIVPDLIVCAPDAPKGRKLVMTPPAAKVWADAHGIPTLQPTTVKGPSFEKEVGTGWDLFIVAAYGKIIPENILYVPKRKTINVHPSLLPLLRGSSPLQSAILADMKNTGVTIMLLDKEMDHGPILAQESLKLASWPVDTETLGKDMARAGAALISQILGSILDGSITIKEQDHSAATFTKKITKEDGEMNLSADGYENWLRFNAFKGWPGSYFFQNGERVKISGAHFENGAFVADTVIPEGKKEMTWKEFTSFSKANP